MFFTRARGWASPWHEMKSTLKTGLASHLTLFYQSESTSSREFPWLLTEFWSPVNHLLLPRTKVWQLRKSCKHFPFPRGKNWKFNLFSEKVITVIQTCVWNHGEERQARYFVLVLSNKLSISICFQLRTVSRIHYG